MEKGPNTPAARVAALVQMSVELGFMPDALVKGLARFGIRFTRREIREAFDQALHEMLPEIDFDDEDDADGANESEDEDYDKLRENEDDDE